MSKQATRRKEDLRQKNIAQKNIEAQSKKKKRPSNENKQKNVYQLDMVYY